MAEQETPAIVLHEVERRYRQGEATLEILTGAELQCGRASRSRWSRRRAPANRRCCISPACSSMPDGGEVYHRRRADLDAVAMPRARASAATTIGFVYQFHHLLPEFSALENVMLPQLIRGLPRARRATRARAVVLSRPRPSGSPTARPNCPAASSSASRSPARSPTRRASCWPTSRPAISTHTPPTMSSRRCTQLVKPPASPR